MYGFIFHDAHDHIPVEKVFNDYHECLREIEKLDPREYPLPFGIDYVYEDDGYVETLMPNIILKPDNYADYGEFEYK